MKTTNLHATKTSLFAMALSAFAACLLALGVAFAAPVQQAWAYEGDEGYLNYPTAAPKIANAKVGDMFLFAPTRIKNIKSSNPSVASAFRDGGGMCLVISCKKAGTATISVTADGKRYSYLVTVTGKAQSKSKKAAYVNPLKKLQVGNVNYAGKYKKAKSFTAKSLLSGKVKVSAKKGWKIAKITVKYKGQSAKALKNGKKVVPERLQYISVKMKNKKSGKAVTLKLAQGKESIAVASAEAIADQTFANGAALSPAPVLKDGSRTLVNGVDYTLSYANNVHVGDASIKVTGKGAYAGTKTLTFRIKGSILRHAQIAPIPDQVLRGAKVEPQLTVIIDGKKLRQGVDFATYFYNHDVVSIPGKRKATVIIKGTGYYKDSQLLSFNVVSPTTAGSSSKSLRAA